MHTRSWLLILAVVGLALPAAAAVPGDQPPLEAPAIAWPEGPGQTLLQQKCLFCHSGEYIVCQRLKPEQWTSEVKKMVKFGAPLSREEQVTLATYLSRHYGVDTPQTPAPRVTPGRP